MYTAPTTGQHADFRPIFIVGYPESGGEQLATMLSRHPKLAAMPNTHYMDTIVPPEENIPHPRKADRKEIFTQFRLADSFPALDMDDETLLSLVRDDYATFFRAILEYSTTRAGKRRIIEATPTHLLFVPTLLSWFPDARIICIARDGRDAVRTVVQKPETHNDLRQHSRDWHHYAFLTHEFLNDFANHFTFLRYEDLLAYPKENLTRLYEFVEENFEPEAFDWSIPADAPPVEAWRDSTEKKDLWLMNAAMQFGLFGFNYPDASLADCPPLTRAWHTIANAAYSIGLRPST